MIRSPYYYKVQVVRVIDGDTIEVEIDLGFNIKVKEVVRLYYVDTPEIFGKNSTEEGYLAKLFTILWLQGLEDQYDFYVEMSKNVPIKDVIEDFIAKDQWLDTLYLDSVKYNAREKYGRVLGLIYRGEEAYSLNTVLNMVGLVK